MGRQEKGEGMPKLYRKRFIPDEIVELKDDRIVYHEGNIMITEWDVLHPKAKFSHGISCYYMDKGWKISKFLNKKKELVYYYCDIIETAYLKAENAYIFTDLLADVIIHPDGGLRKNRSTHEYGGRQHYRERNQAGIAKSGLPSASDL